jgi:hypothetical protein
MTDNETQPVTEQSSGHSLNRLVGQCVYHDTHGEARRQWGEITRESESHVWIKWDGNDGPLRRWRKDCGFFKHCCHVTPNTELSDSRPL